MNSREHFKFVIGDFNSRTGINNDPRERASEHFGLGEGNQRGTLLVEWTTSHGLYITNSLFPEKTNSAMGISKWTHKKTR